MLTAKGDDTDRIVGLELGADDYLPKPFNPRELAARIHAILRRTTLARSDAEPPTRVVVGDVILDSSSRTVWLNGGKTELTTAEFDLLQVLLLSAGNVVSREELSQRVLDRVFNPFDRSIDTHVSNLRRKLGVTVNGVERIKSVRGIGYIYAQLTRH